MHVCNAVQGKLVSLLTVLIDVGHSETRQFLHDFVVTGHGGQFNGPCGEALTVGSGRQEQQQEQRADVRRHGCRSSMISRRPRLLESQLCSVVCLLVQAVTFGIKTGHRCWTEAKDKVCAMGVRVGFCEWESHGVDYIN